MDDRLRYQRLYEAYTHSVEIADPDERGRYLDAFCDGDDALREDIEGLLRVGRDEKAITDFLDTLIDRRRADIEAVLDETSEFLGSSPAAPAALAGGFSVGAQIGKFTIRRQLGEGGFGIVYEAEQTRPVKRMVALKVIKPGMDTNAVIARFEAERQALALMDHSCVAKVLDGGVTDTGLPYFAMELVDGLPITTQCDTHSLSVQERLELFIRVCEAVQHAHSKGVIHRDLKPSNILVSLQDGRHIPKVIDFGIAKALEQKLAEATIFTQQGQMIGTPEYMSPEQAELGEQGIDTRSDVYALGVILYELLTGVRPIEAETLRKAGLYEIQRIIREVEPPRPSTRLGSGSDATFATRAARARRTEVKALAGTLRRDLDWVVMKCLEKDRARRYDTPVELAAELSRFLKNEPVLAGPPSVMYAFGKFARRNRALVSSAAVIVLVLLLGIFASSVFAYRANRARAVMASALLERDSALEAEQIRGAELHTANKFLYKMLRKVKPEELGATTISTVTGMLRDELDDQLTQDERDRIGSALGRFFDESRQHDLGRLVMKDMLLDRIAPRMDEWLEARPQTRPLLEVALASQMLHLGYYEESVAYGQRALASLDGSDRYDLVGFQGEAVMAVASSLSMLERFDDIERLYKDFDMSGDLDIGELDSSDVGARRDLLWGLGLNFYESQRFEAAARYYRQGVRLAMRYPEVVNIEDFRQPLANTLRDLGELDEAERLYQETIAEHTGDASFRLALSFSHANYSKLLLVSNRLEEAEHHAREGQRLLGVEYGAHSYPAANGRAKLADVLSARGRHEEAQIEYAKAHAVYLEILGPTHRRTLELAQRIADAYERWDRDEPGAGHAESARRWEALAQREGQPGEEE